MQTQLTPDTLRLAVQQVQMNGFVLFESAIPRERIDVIRSPIEIPRATYAGLSKRAQQLFRFQRIVG